MNRKYLLLCGSVSLVFTLSVQAKADNLHYACVVKPNGKAITKISDRIIEKDEINEIIQNGGYPGPCATYADRRSLGNGYMQSYAQLLPDNTPYSIGLEFPASTLENQGSIRRRRAALRTQRRTRTKFGDGSRAAPIGTSPSSNAWRA